MVQVPDLIGFTNYKKYVESKSIGIQQNLLFTPEILSHREKINSV